VAFNSANAVSPLTQHAVAVSQSMSAFYMYSLSEGDTRYQEEYQRYLSDASGYLDEFAKHDSVVASELKNQWSELQPNLKFDFVDGAGYIIHMSIRNEFRAYLDNVYVKVSKLISAETDLVNQMHLMTLDVEAMVARFFDVSSALYGSMAISASQDTLKPDEVAKKLRVKLTRMMDMPISDKVKRKLRSVDTKWSFIEESVVNYTDKAAYLLVYYNKNQINKALSKSQSMLAGV
jgi:hypothetical protein